MAYKDEQRQKDYGPRGDRDYTEEEKSTRRQSGQIVHSAGQGQQAGKQRKSLFSRMRDALTGGVSDAGQRAKIGFLSWKSEQAGSKGFGGILKSIASPKKLAVLASAAGIGTFSIFGLFSTYKNDDAGRNDNPLSCETGYIEFAPRTSAGINVKQETVDTFYDIFCRTMGYSEEFLTGMLACMNAECGLHYSGIEYDWVTEATDPDGNKERRYDFFYSRAGGGDINDTVVRAKPTTAQVLEAYHDYSDLIGPTWITGPGDKAVGVYTCDNGRFGAGIGLIGWTGNNGVDFITSVDKIYQDYEWYDLAYQCAYILAGFKADETDSMMRSGKWRTEMQAITKDMFTFTGNYDSDGKKLYSYNGDLYGGNRTGSSVDADNIPEDQLEGFAAAKWYFENYVNGGPSDQQKFAKILDRWDGIPEITGMIASARVNAKYSADVTSMADLIYMNTVNDETYDAQNAQICENGTVVDNVDIAMAALSISWLEKADYKNDEAAYGEYKRSTSAPILINDWNFVDGADQPGMGDKNAHKAGVYGSGDGELEGLDKYSAKDCGETHDLIACTEFYYYAHLIAFPEETTTGFFSSCDRGTGTAVRISGADDNFPAGNPPIQLEYVLGSNTQNLFGQGPADRSDQQNGQNQKLWKATGFLRGCDWYSFEGRNGIPEGNIMIAWDQPYSNGFGNGTWNVADKGAEMNLRFILTNSSTQTHIVTYTGGAAVRTFWGTRFLLEQYNHFDDADSLVRGDLTVQAPKSMQDGANFKATYAKDAFDQNVTFYIAQQQHADDGNLSISSGGSAAKSLVTGREDTQYNQKTGLPEFRSWEQIFMRLTHNVDDGGIPIEYPTSSDGYLDDYGDHITQYGKDASSSTKANTYYFKDWDGAGGNGGVHSSVIGSAKWGDDGSDKWTNAMGLSGNYYWRYEIATDSEYRTNQIERFSMAGLMCSYASENDANAYQNDENAGSSSNSSGHILGNAYRRMSRIGENSDISGRYYYYNTVVSNDMLQDLVQLYNTEGPGTSSIEDGQNFGPYYDLSETMPGASSAVRSGYMGDRRYGFTAADVANILSGYSRPDGYTNAAQNVDERAGWGTDDGMSNDFGHSPGEPGSMANRLYKYMTTPLYDIGKEIRSYGSGSGGETGNEGNHSPSPKADAYYVSQGAAQYAQELYGINPYLMIKEYNGGDAGTRSDKPEDDDWMSFIDRHYWADKYGNINLYAYALLATNPSAGTMTSPAQYGAALQNMQTIDGGKMSECVGNLKYTDYTYSDDGSGNIGKALFGDDDRDGDGNRDDYNRREYILIPYYHTHMQDCSHDERLPDIEYELVCDWTIDESAPHGYSDDSGKIDTIYYLNGNCVDAVETFTLDSGLMNLRGKYNVAALEKLSAYKGAVRYFSESGTELSPTAKPPIHVSCGGCRTEHTKHDPLCDMTIECDHCGKELACGESCSHSCDECLSLPHVAHGAEHQECDGGGRDGKADDCHEQYGCNYLEWYYHNGGKIYMAIQVVDHPVETFDITPYMKDGKVNPDKANLAQLIDYDHLGYVYEDYMDPINTMASPNHIGSGGLVAHPERKNHPENEKAAYNPGKAPNFVGYFTIEGNVITRDFNERGESVTGPGICDKKDLALIESVRNRVGDGKRGEAERGQTILQEIGFYSGADSLGYDRSPKDSGTTPDGYGEVYVTGASHDLSPASAGMTSADIGNAAWLCGGYGDPNTGGGSGPDTANGNASLAFGDSLIRYLLGDEHVYHTRFGSQDKDVVTGAADPSLGYDFQYFEEFVDIDPDSAYIDSQTGELTMSEYAEDAERFKDPATGEYDAQADGLRNDPISINDKAGSNKPKSLGNQFGGGTGKTVLQELIDRYKDPNGDGDTSDEIKGWDNGPNGDYGLWITHASRGDRGMKTQYVILKDWFGDPYDGDYTSPNMQYMAFEPVMAKDSMDRDGDGDFEEPYIYGHSVFGATRTDSETWYGQGSNSYWRKLIDIYTASLQAPQ